MKISSKIIASFGEIKKSPLIIKGLLILLFSSFFIRTFVYVTTNRLYNPDIDEIVIPLLSYSLILILSLGITLSIYFILVKRLIDYLIISSLAVLLITFTLGIYGFSPCLFKHSSSYVDHIHPHPITYILKQSFLCPSYSHNSRFHLLFFAGLSFTTFIICIAEKKLNENMQG